jgi:hypothetical protein
MIPACLAPTLRSHPMALAIRWSAVPVCPKSHRMRSARSLLRDASSSSVCLAGASSHQLLPTVVVTPSAVMGAPSRRPHFRLELAVTPLDDGKDLTREQELTDALLDHVDRTHSSGAGVPAYFPPAQHGGGLLRHTACTPPALGLPARSAITDALLERLVCLFDGEQWSRLGPNKPRGRHSQT